MACNCVYFKRRTKKGIFYGYCTLKRSEVPLNASECYMCENKEYKKYKPIKKVSKTNKITKATSISKEVKLIVWKRDNHECIFCHKKVSWNCANSHYIKRSHLGKGIEENLFTACLTCHDDFDNTTKREEMLPIAKRHLIGKYSYWNESMLIYKKYNK